MALRLSGRIGAARRVGPVFGVTMDFGPISYAAWRTAEARAAREARERLPEAAVSAMEVVLAGDAATDAERRHRDRMNGLAAQLFLEALVAEHATGWGGVENDDGEPAPLTAANFRALCDGFPMVAEAIMTQLSLPHDLLESEGNAFAPSRPGHAATAPNPATPAQDSTVQ